MTLFMTVMMIIMTMITVSKDNDLGDADLAVLVKIIIRLSKNILHNHWILTIFTIFRIHWLKYTI